MRLIRRRWINKNRTRCLPARYSLTPARTIIERGFVPNPCLPYCTTHHFAACDEYITSPIHRCEYLSIYIRWSLTSQILHFESSGNLPAVTVMHMHAFRLRKEARKWKGARCPLHIHLLKWVLITKTLFKFGLKIRWVPSSLAPWASAKLPFRVALWREVLGYNLEFLTHLSPSYQQTWLSS